MNNDPAWDMPTVNWQQQGSFQIPTIPPSTEPDEEPLICLPPINQYWLPFVMGCLDQLRNPSSWIVADDDSMGTTLYRAARLREMIGGREDCPVTVQIRVEGCNLQTSVDAGDTWTTVDGWTDFLSECIPPQTKLSFDSGCTLSESFDDGATFTAVPGWLDNFADCVQKYVPIIGLPPNPGDQDPDQLACSIATYLAETVIIQAMGKAVTAIQDDLTLLQFGLSVLNIIPEFVLVGLAADAFSGIYVAVQEGTLSDFEDALTDPTLLSDVRCAIYNCIVGAGYVTPDNVDCILTSIAAISYSHSDVIDAIVAYLTALGPVGLAQLSQVAGLEQGADCTGCAAGEWCYVWDGPTNTGDTSGWDFGYEGFGVDTGSWVPGQGFVGDLFGGGATSELHAKWDWGYPVSIDEVVITYECPTASGTGNRQIITDAFNHTLNGAAGSFEDTYTGGTGNNFFIFRLDSALVAAGTVNTISRMQIYGKGVCPFGTPNC